MKPPLTLLEQCDLLIGRGLEVEDSDAFIQFLSEHNYYRLRGYFHPFLIDYGGAISDQFQSGTTAAIVEDLVDFDRRLRVLLYEVLAIFETRFRASLAYHSGLKNPYLHIDGTELTPEFTTPRNGEELSAFLSWLSGYEESLEKHKKNEIVDWHRKSKDGRLPIWAAVEILDLGKVSRLYRGLNETLKVAIADDFQMSVALMKGAVASLNTLRNHVAHHSRIWNLHYSNSPTTRTSKLPYDLHHLCRQSDYQHHKLFTRLSLLLWLDRGNDFGINFKNRLFALLHELPNSDFLTLESMGYSDSFRTAELWAGFKPTT